MEVKGVESWKVVELIQISLNLMSRAGLSDSEGYPALCLIRGPSEDFC